MLRFFKAPERIRWWEIEDKGGWPLFWWPRPPLEGANQLPIEAPWPGEWRQRPHP